MDLYYKKSFLQLYLDPNIHIYNNRFFIHLIQGLRRKYNISYQLPSKPKNKHNMEFRYGKTLRKWTLLQTWTLPHQPKIKLDLHKDIICCLKLNERNCAFSFSITIWNDQNIITKSFKNKLRIHISQNKKWLKSPKWSAHTYFISLCWIIPF